jgi:hypothetical protein
MVIPALSLYDSVENPILDGVLCSLPLDSVYRGAKEKKTW